MTPYESFLRDAWAKRPKTPRDKFYDRFYSGSGIDQAIPRRLLDALENALGESLDALHPSDNLLFGFEGVNFADILYRLERVFAVQLPVETIPVEIDGTVDSLIRAIARRLDA
ncbi:MAG: hypothetical protein KY475_17750 [Planctomycetes bacterium]|nr:hypothetical protein [Planctomycetota bacterium]